ncbi:MAG TPA: OmpA family protein [Bacteroidetes bacterium]|jgi:chemotaxis protein MotB|nr:OmpA family protein [Bacteroidota bacterium]
MNRAILLLVITISVAVTSFSCVSGKKYKTLESTSQQFMNERDDLKTDNIRLNMSNTELEAELSRIKNQIVDVQDQYDIVTSERDKALEDLARLNSKYNDLQTAQEDLIKGNVRETQKLLGELQDAQKSLQEKEDLLRQLEENLDLKKASLDELTFELEKRNERLLELEKVIDAQKRIAEDLKNKVSEALLGFENDGLTVSMKDGKVYVSLDEQLLFRSGSWEIDQKGRSALQNLAGVLERNPDIQISIEGHTDDVPYRGSGQLVDNWDLSVKRATTVVRVLLSGSNIDPKRLTASGRSEYVPIDPANTATARQKNRRTEVVLTPDLSSLYDIINSY